MARIGRKSWFARKARRIAKDERGNAIIELAFALPFLALLFIGSFGVGLTFDRLLTQGQLTRNAGNMYARGIKFDNNQTKQFLVNAAIGMNLQIDGTGDTVVYLTLLTRVPDDAMCVDQNNNTVPCGNQGLVVVAQRFAVGNTSLYDSTFGMPGAQNIDPDGNVIDYMHQSYAQATVPARVSDAVNGMKEDEFLFAADTHHDTSLLSFPVFFAPQRTHAWAYY